VTWESQGREAGHPWDQIRVSINGGTPIAGWFIRENPIKMDDEQEYPH